MNSTGSGPRAVISCVSPDDCAPGGAAMEASTSSRSAGATSSASGSPTSAPAAMPVISHSRALTSRMMPSRWISSPSNDTPASWCSRRSSRAAAWELRSFSVQAARLTSSTATLTTPTVVASRPEAITVAPSAAAAPASRRSAAIPAKCRPQVASTNHSAASTRRRVEPDPPARHSPSANTAPASSTHSGSGGSSASRPPDSRMEAMPMRCRPSADAASSRPPVRQPTQRRGHSRFAANPARLPSIITSTVHAVPPRA